MNRNVYINYSNLDKLDRKVLKELLIIKVSSLCVIKNLSKEILLNILEFNQ